MDVIVTVDQHFSRTADGAIWTPAQFPYPFWTRYLEVFDGVKVVARVGAVASVPSDWKQANGDGVAFVEVPDFYGPRQYMRFRSQIKQITRSAFNFREAVILRVPSQLGQDVLAPLQPRKFPYGLEVVGDPYDVFAPGAVRHPLSPFFRWWFPRQLRRQCYDASAVAYVTANSLQRRYPTSPTGYSTYYSDVVLPATAFVDQPRRINPQQKTFKLVMVGSLEQLYKAPDVIIDAISQNVREGLDLHLVFVGDGKYRPQLENQVAALGLGDRIQFVGQLPTWDAVQAQLDRADIFLLPSRTEGLPRAMIEAMARGLPCIGSTMGGIPELLPAEDMVIPGDVGDLAQKIRDLVTHPDRMERMSARNLEKAKEYNESALRSKRVLFYQCVREKTETWLRTSKA